jgi:hypothetical protein
MLADPEGEVYDRTQLPPVPIRSKTSVESMVRHETRRPVPRSFALPLSWDAGMPKSTMANWRYLFHPVWCLTDCSHVLQYLEKSQHGSGGTSSVQFVDISASPCLFRANATRRSSFSAT